MNAANAAMDMGLNAANAGVDAVPASDPSRALRLGWWIILAGIGGFLLWAALAPLDKGVPLSGTVTVETNRKAVQHELGGTVEEILVQDGQRVKAGDVLVRMNAVLATAEAETLRAQFHAARAAETRLLAERDGTPMEFDAELQQRARQDAKVAQMLAAQQQLHATRRNTLQSELAGLDQSIAGLQAQQAGLQGSVNSRRQRLALLQQQLDSHRALADGGFVAPVRLLELEQALAQQQAEISEGSGQTERTQRQISELGIKRAQVVQERRKEVHTQLAEVQRELAALESKLAGLDHNLRNIAVTAPVDGTVIGLSVHTRGAVVAPGFKLMDLVPAADALVVEGRLPVHLIDKVHPALPVELSFSAFNQNTTPRVPGEVTSVSADRLTDERTGEPYYRLLAAVTPEGVRELGKAQVRAGMPVDLFVKTGERTLLNYIVRPLADHFRRSMTEE